MRCWLLFFMPETTSGLMYVARPFFFPSHQDRTRGASIPHCGFGHVTVLAQIHPIDVAVVPSERIAGGYKFPIFSLASLSISSPYCLMSAASPSAPFHSPILESAKEGCIGSRSLNVTGISKSALFINTATGFRSEALTGSPNLWASIGIEPPPAKGSIIVGGFPFVESRISRWASFIMSPFFISFQSTKRTINLWSRSRSIDCSFSVGKRSGLDEGSSTSCANKIALAHANLLLANHPCILQGWPFLFGRSFSAAAFISSRGKDTSINFLRITFIMVHFLYSTWVSSLIRYMSAQTSSRYRRKHRARTAPDRHVHRPDAPRPSRDDDSGWCSCR